eukprot:gene1481-1822_t
MADLAAGMQDQCSSQGVHGPHSSSSSAAGEVLNVSKIFDHSCSALAAIGSHYTAAAFQECHVAANSPVCSNNLRLESLVVAPLDGPAAEQVKQLYDASPASAWQLTGTKCMASATMAPCIMAASPRKQKKDKEAPVTKGATSQHRSRLQKKTDELQAIKAEMAALQSGQECYRKKLEIVWAENADLLTRLTNVTSKWRQSVTENAGLTQALGGLQQQLANLELSLATCQQELAELRSQQLFNRN